MANTSPQPSPRRSGTSMRVFAGVAIVVVLLAAALTGLWFYAAHQLDRRVASALDAAAQQGTTISCRDRSVFGYPFRIGLHCADIGVNAPDRGIKVAAGSLRTAAQVYDPTRIVAELDGPLLLDAPNLPPLSMNWRLAQASTALYTEGLQRMDVAIDDPTLGVRSGSNAEAAAPLLSSTRLEMHFLRNGEALLFALSDDAIKASLPNGTQLPSLNVLADIGLDKAGSWLETGIPGGRLDTALRGQSGSLRNVSIAVPGATGQAALSGPFSVSPDGLISGDFRLAVTDPNDMAATVAQLAPPLASVARALAKGIAFAGSQDNGQSVVDFQVRNGEMRLGFIPLGRLPPI